MDWKKLLYRTMVLTTIVICGMALFAIAFNVFIMMGIMPDNLDGRAVIQKTTYVFAASFLFSVGSFFIKESWGKILLFSPLYAPILFALINILIH